MSKNLLQKLLALLLLIIFSVQYITVTCYTHKHTIDGITTIHSHFYLKHTKQASDSPADHEHNSAELTLISILSTLPRFVISILLLTIVQPRQLGWKKYYIFDKFIPPLNDCSPNTLLRAPPVFA